MVVFSATTIKTGKKRSGNETNYGLRPTCNACNCNMFSPSIAMCVGTNCRFIGIISYNVSVPMCPDCY